MLEHVDIKICGLTSARDVDMALAGGADYFGFIVYPKSPRGVTLARAVELAARVPSGKRVIVDIESSLDDLLRYRDGGFDKYQIHANVLSGLETLRAWSELVGTEALWLAPRLPPGEPFPVEALNYAQTILVDTYAKGQVGGTGQTGDWVNFAKWQQEYARTKWILAGGLSPENVFAAIAATGARHIDVNSGVEQAPGQKDPQKMRELFRLLRPKP